MQSNTTVAGFILMTTATTLVAQQAETLRVNDPRPVLQAVLEIERRYGTPINYEDLRYEFSNDVEDVTDSVLTPQQRNLADPKKRILVPRQRSIEVAIGSRSVAPWQPDPAAALAAARAAATAASDAATSFVVTEANGSIFVAGIRSRDASGKSQTYAPALSTPVTLAAGPRTALESLISIVKQVSERSGYRIELGTVPVRMLAESEVNVLASNEAASFVVDRLLRGLPLSPSVSSANGRSTISYQLLFDPRSRVYALNISAAFQGAASPEAGSGLVERRSSPDRFFRKN